MTKQFSVTGGQNYTLASSIGSTDTSILLSSFTEPISGVPYTMALINTVICYGTISPQSTNSEFISFSGITQNADGTATLTGVTRGLGRSDPFASSSTFELPHAGQSIFILSDAPEVFSQYAAKANDETITGTWTFNNFPVTPSNTPATPTVLGISKLSTTSATPLAPVVVATEDTRIPIAYAIDASGTDAYVITPSPAITSYAAGQQFTFKAGTANTGAATLNVNGLGAKTIKRNVSADLVTGDILVNQIVGCTYDGTVMQLTSNILPAVLPILSGGTGNTIPYTSGTLAIAAPANGSTTVIAHGLGVIPKHVKVTMFSNANANTQSVGNYDGTTNRAIYKQLTGSTLSAAVSASFAILDVVNGTGSTSGALTWDATNFTITWTSSNPEANVIFWEAQSF